MWLYLTLGIIALGIYLLTSCKFDYWEKKGIPTASGCEWFFGHFRPILFVKKHLNDYYGAMYREFPDAPLVGYYVMSSPGLVVKDLDIIKFIMVSEFGSFNANGLTVDKTVDILAGSNPFFLSGDEWKTARARVTPALTLAKLKGYLPSILSVGDELVKFIKNNGPHAELETRDLASRFTTDVIANAIFGVKNNTFENKDSLFALITREIVFEMSVAENLKFFIQQIPLVRSLFPMRFSPKKLQDMIVSLISTIIAERTATGEKRSDVMQVLMTLKENDTEGVVTNEYMSGHVFTIMADLYDTSSNAICMILYRLSRHPEIQEKLRDEFSHIRSKNNGELTIEDIENAKYLEMVICESFRFYSFMSSRECTQDCYLPMPNSSPLKITKGTSFIIPASSIHMDAKYYPDPETFNPERFTEEEIAKRPKYTYMPFGEGPKKCMGMRIATLQIKIAVMKILENFSLTPSPKTKYPIEYDPAASITIRPKDGAWVIFEEIKQKGGT